MRNAHKGRVLTEEAPWKFPSPLDSDPQAGLDWHTPWRAVAARLGGLTQISPVVLPGNPEGLGEFSGTRTQLTQGGAVASGLHGVDASEGLEGPQEHESVAGGSLDEDIQHPVHPVVEVDVSHAGRMGLDKLPDRRAKGRMASRVAIRSIGFRFDHSPRTGTPDQRATHQF